MSKPVHIPTTGVFLSASVASRIRHILVSEMQAARRNHERIDEDVAETVNLIDIVGAAWANRRRANLSSDVSSDVSTLPNRSFDRVDWDTVTAKSAAEQLGITPQAVTGLLDRGSLHGEKSGRVWRVCAESVTARQEGTTCRH